MGVAMLTLPVERRQWLWPAVAMVLVAAITEVAALVLAGRRPAATSIGLALAGCVPFLLAALFAAYGRRGRIEVGAGRLIIVNALRRREWSVDGFAFAYVERFDRSLRVSLATNDGVARVMLPRTMYMGKERLLALIDALALPVRLGPNVDPAIGRGPAGGAQTA